MAHELRIPGLSDSESPFHDHRTISRHNEDGLLPLYSATATTDYTAFVGKEEFFSSDDSLPPRQKTTSRARAKKSRKAQRALDSNNNSIRSLRPALDILSRLRHDPEFSSQTFTIGYVDRHCPEVMEIPLGNWKGGDVTDEEFIPQHRILWFKRDSDGKKIWDRKERLDEIFGSGLVSVRGTGNSDAADSREVKNVVEDLAVATEQTSEDASVNVDSDKYEGRPDMLASGILA